MKSYMDIEALRDEEIVIGDIIREKNDQGFEVGDTIQITEKYDGANASIEKIDGIISCFSRRLPLNENNTLNGFYTYILKKVANGLSIPDNIVIFGEWSGARNKIVYTEKNKWFVFDIFDRTTETYWPQKSVKAFCESHNLDYIHELYYGPFISWEHCRGFMHSPAYGDTQEGIVVKNQDKLVNPSGYFYLKLVNTEYKESKLSKEPRRSNPEKDAEKEKATELIKTVVTENRVLKAFNRLKEDGIIGASVTPSDIPTIAKNLPGLVYKDCMKEEPEIMLAAGEYAGKVCNNEVMHIVRKLVTGQ